jgi:surface antigen-like variable number repeat protein
MGRRVDMPVVIRRDTSNIVAPILVGFLLVTGLPTSGQAPASQRVGIDSSESGVLQVDGDDSQAPRTCGTERSVESWRTVHIVNLTFDGAISMAPTDRDQIAASITSRAYFGDPDEVTSQVLTELKSAWQERGYLNAKVQGEARVLSSSPADQRVTIAVDVDEGEQYRLGSIDFENNKIITDIQALRDLFPLQNGELFDPHKISKGLENLKLAYRGLGYINFTSFPKTVTDEGNKTVSLEIDCDEGKQFSVEQIDILGLDESAFQQVQRDLFVKPGDIYNERLVNLFVEKLASLIPVDTSQGPRFNLSLNERAATVAITYDFRHCAEE